jgi:hypothetical protein
MRLSKKIGFALAGIHLLAFFLFIIYLDSAEGGQGGMAGLLWAVWLPIDFPISLVVTIGLEAIPDTIPIGAFLRTWLPHFVHGIFGTLWWLYLPTFIAMFFSWLGEKAKSNKNLTGQAHNKK